MLVAESNDAAGEPKEIALALVPFPIQPTHFVVLAIAVVVSLLGPAEFVSRTDHRHALGQQQRAPQVALLLFAQGSDRQIVAVPFRAAIPGIVVIGAVAILLQIGFIMLLPVAGQIVQRETVMGGDKIDAGRMQAAGGFVEV